MELKTHDDYWKAKETVRRLTDAWLRGMLPSETSEYLDDLVPRVEQWEKDHPILPAVFHTPS